MDVLMLPQQPAAVGAALLLLRNLAFDPELRSPALANQQLLPLLLAAAESVTPPGQLQQQQLLDAGGLGRPGSSSGAMGNMQQGWVPLYGKPVIGGAVSSAGGNAANIAGGSSSRPGSPGFAGSASGGGLGGGTAVPSAAGNLCCAVYAVSALWALMYQGEKVKAAVRKLPAAAARLAAVREHAQQLLEEAQQEAARLDPTGASATSSTSDTAAVSDREKQHRDAAVAVAGKVGKGVVAAASSLAGVRDGAWWLEQLAESCSSVLDIMESACKAAAL
jgi:uncharacterized membrane protein